MGNENSKNGDAGHSHRLEQLCSLTTRDYPRAYRLSFDPFFIGTQTDMASSSTDISFSGMVDEAEETQPLRPVLEGEGHAVSRTGQVEIGDLAIQKNQFSSKLPKKIKKISKGEKTNASNKVPKGGSSRNTEEAESNSNETAVDEGIRDQNNCKSYHKLVKNYLIEHGMADMIDQFETKYHTRYYFIVSLLIIKYKLKQDHFPAIYQEIVDNQLATQQHKIDRKSTDLKTITAKLSNIPADIPSPFRSKMLSLQRQIQHIGVVKREIGDYSMRSCRAFFQGEIEESLRILYLKNDPVMRKKYYFEEALNVVKSLQFDMRKSTHP